jgi:hypothetical protein
LVLVVQVEPEGLVQWRMLLELQEQQEQQVMQGLRLHLEV